MQCNKKVVTISNLIYNICLVRYPWPIEIMYDHGSELLGRKFDNTFIQHRYGITSKPELLGNPQANYILKIYTRN